jgi:hypothetical protein
MLSVWVITINCAGHNSFFPPGGEETNEKKGKKKVASLAMGVVVRMPWLLGE